MAVFSVEIDDADVARVLTAVAVNYNRPQQIANPDYDEDATIANPDYDDTIPEDLLTNPSTIPDPNQVALIDNPETTAQFCNRIVRQFLAEHVRAYETQIAKDQAAQGLDTTIVISDPQL